MTLQSLEINSVSITDEVGNIDWGFVINTPIIDISDGSHSHNDRYYLHAEVDSRISSLTIAIDDLEEKVIELFN